MATHQKRALVTGGAGLIGSYIVDLLVREGWKVRILDNLEPNTHKHGKPAWVNPQAVMKMAKAQKMKPKSTSRRFDTKIESTIGIEK